MSALTLSERRAVAEDLIYRSALHLDQRSFGAWLDLTAPEFRYRIEAHSPELKKDMIWLEHDRAGMAALIELLPKHHINGATWLRHVTLYTATPEPDDQIRAVSSLVVFQTALDIGDSHVEAGTTRLFLAGRYHDKLRREGEQWLLTERVVRIDTRELGVGSHLFP